MIAKQILLIISVCALIGCSKKEGPAHAARSNKQTVQALAAFREIAESARSSPPEQRLTVTQFFAKVLLPAYEEFGRKNPRWDNEAKRFLSIVSTNFAAEITAGMTEETTEERQRLPPLAVVVEAAATAEKAGCEDPLVRYLILRQRYDPFDGGAEVTNQWVRAADDLEQLDYHPYWKFFARLHAAYALRAEARKIKARADVQAMANQCNDLSLQMLQDHSLPMEAIYSVVDELYIKEMRKPGIPKYAIDTLQPLLIEGWGDTAEAWYSLGRFHIRYAWEQRGTGYAKTVTEQGWQGMAENLGMARIAFEKSWGIKPLEDTAVRMLTVEIGNTEGRAAMETWFDRAMQINPASFAAAMAKFQWLTKSWHGSDTEVIAFGRECVTNTAYRGRVPLVNREVHRGLAEIHRMNGKGEEEDYWREPGVWPDVKATFERFFEVSPENMGSRYDYALLAYYAGAWDDFRAQIKLIGQIGPIDYEFFGGEDAFQEMLTDAEKNR